MRVFWRFTLSGVCAMRSLAVYEMDGDAKSVTPSRIKSMPTILVHSASTR
jgi:hypothetical protein